MTEWVKTRYRNKMILSPILLMLMLTVIVTIGTSVLAKTPPSLYRQGYAKGASDAKLVQSSFPASASMNPDEVDCDSDIDPHLSNEDYCSGYQHGFSDTINELLKR